MQPQNTGVSPPSPPGPAPPPPIAPPPGSPPADTGSQPPSPFDNTGGSNNPPAAPDNPVTPAKNAPQPPGNQAPGSNQPALGLAPAPAPGSGNTPPNPANVPPTRSPAGEATGQGAFAALSQNAQSVNNPAHQGSGQGALAALSQNAGQLPPFPATNEDSNLAGSGNEGSVRGDSSNGGSGNADVPAGGSAHNGPGMSTDINPNLAAPGDQGDASVASLSPGREQIAGQANGADTGVAPSSGQSAIFTANGVTIIPGAPAATIANTPVSINSEGNVANIGGVVQALAPGSPLTVGSQVFRPSKGNINLPNSNNAPSLVLGTAVLTQAPDGSFSSGSISLSPGQATTLSGTIISLAPGGSVAVVNGATSTLAAGEQNTQAPSLTVGNSFFTQGSGGVYQSGSVTLRPGQATTISGVSVSLAGDDSFAVVGGKTSFLASAGRVTQAPSLTIGNSIFTQGPGGVYQSGSMTLRPGQVTTVSGSSVSLASDDSFAIINGKTSRLAQAGGVTSAPTVTLGNEVFTEGPNGVLTSGSEKIQPGQATVVAGTSISVMPGGFAVVINGHTSTLAQATVTPGLSGPQATPTGRPTSTMTGTSNPVYTGAATSSFQPHLQYTYVCVALAILGVVMM